MAQTPSLVDALRNTSRPAFTYGVCPPREGTTDEQALDAAAKFAKGSAHLASDGFIVYDIQDEAGRTTDARPFPYRPTIDPAGFGALLRRASGKECVIYKSVGEPNEAAFDKWLTTCRQTHGHRALNLVGAATSRNGPLQGVSLGGAAARVVDGPQPDVHFGCVTIAERHLAKGTEHLNIQRKVDLGAEWFISQAVFDPGATVALLNAYGDLCKSSGAAPKQVLLTFAPVGRRKTMAFVHWLGVSVPQEVEAEILKNAPPEGAPVKEVQAASRVAVKTCINLMNKSLQGILQATASSGVPLGLNIESVSGYMEECMAACDLFFALQHTLLTHYRQQNWAVRWVDVRLARDEEARQAHRGALAKTGSPLPAALHLAAAAGAGAALVFFGLKFKGKA